MGYVRSASGHFTRWKLVGCSSRTLCLLASFNCPRCVVFVHFHVRPHPAHEDYRMWHRGPWPPRPRQRGVAHHAHAIHATATVCGGHDDIRAYKILSTTFVCACRYLSCGQVVTPLEASQREDLMPPPFRRLLDWASGGWGEQDLSGTLASGQGVW